MSNNLNKTHTNLTKHTKINLIIIFIGKPQTTILDRLNLQKILFYHLSITPIQVNT